MPPILQDGYLSCAFFASSVMHNFKLIGAPHATVDGTLRDMLASGWLEVDPETEPREGSVIVWEAGSFDGAPELHKHIGFYVGNGEAISNYKTHGHPAKHPWQNGRKVEKVLWHPLLG